VKTMRTNNPPIELPIPWWMCVTGLLVLFLLGFFGYIGFFQRNNAIIRGVYVGGLNLGGRTPEEAKVLLRDHYDKYLYKPVDLQYGKFRPRFIPGDVGFSIDLDSMVRSAFYLGHHGGLFHGVWDRLCTRIVPHNLPLKVKTDREMLTGFYAILKEKIEVEPVAVQFIVTPEGEVTQLPGRVGRRINTARLTTLIQGAIWQQDAHPVTIPVDLIRPTVMEDEVRKWSLDTVLGLYTTRFNPGAVDRSSNLRVAAASINNCLLQPGEVFSFNQKVGPRVAEKGYREAPVIIKKKLVPGIGGGVCQVTGTLYNALLYAGFSEFNRANHSLPSGYVPMGRDATVVYGGQDFTFKNTLSTPVLIVTNYDPNGRLTVAVMGKKTHDHKVKLVTVIKKMVPFSTVEETDPSLAPGQRKTEEKGKNGYKVELWRIWMDGQEQIIRRELVNRSYYPPIPSLVKVGVGAPLGLPVTSTSMTAGQP
jgi:vancomycin resistance protein YoaR